jgi:lysophospholipase L1-like esterase
LGDSYTIGESITAAQRWPVQLLGQLQERGLDIALTIIACTGWTTDELLMALEREDPRGPFDLVTLLIGVNNQYRGGDIEVYRREFQALLERAIGFADGRARKVVVLSIPDWSVTPFAEGLDRRQIAREIDRFNGVNQAMAEASGARYVDVTRVSREAARDPSLVAGDGLHPSGKMYALWVDLALPAVLATLGEGSER